MALMDDLRQRVTTRMQLTTDGHTPYLQAVEEAFGADIDYAMLVKLYGEPPHSQEAARRYSPSDCVGTRKTKITGNPEPRHISTSYVERQNLTMWMHMRRFTRLTNAFSKKIENHAYAVALHVAFYNFVRMHKTLRMTTAMAAGIADRLWSMEDIVALVDAAEGPPRKRGSYKPRQRRPRDDLMDDLRDSGCKPVYFSWEKRFKSAVPDGLKHGLALWPALIDPSFFAIF